MKRITELEERNKEVLSLMEGIQNKAVSEKRNKTEEETNEFRNFQSEIEKNEAEINDLTVIAKRSTQFASKSNTKVEDKNDAVSFRDYFKAGNFTKEFQLDKRAFQVANDSAVIQRTIGKLDILTSPAEDFLRKLGVTFWNCPTGQFIVPSMAEDTATFPGETVAGADSSMNTLSLTLAPRRLTHSATVTRELLDSGSPEVYAGILQNLYNGIWNGITKDLFTQIDADGASRKSTFGGSTLNYGQIVQMEASIGGLNIGQGAYVTTPSVKAYLKKTAGLTNQKAIMDNNEVNGYPAFGVPAVTAGEIVFGDFSRTSIGMWEAPQIIVNPYTGDDAGTVKLTIWQNVDTGVSNPRGIVILTNASIF
jgi:HK97 family phage major capsid protein